MTLPDKLRLEVEKNLQNGQFGVEELAIGVGMSRSNLHRRLRDTYGQSVSQFIREYRLNKALEILKSEECTVAEAAHRVGFSSSSYFSKRFTEYYGYPPVEVNKPSISVSQNMTITWTKSRFFLLAVIFFVGVFSIYQFIKNETVAVLPLNGMNADKFDHEEKGVIGVSYTPSEEAHNYLLRGNDQSVNRSNRKGIETAFDFFKKAIQLDPNYADAYVELANLWIVSGAAWGIKPQTAWDSAQIFLSKALELNPNNGKANHILAAGQYLYDWNFTEANKNFTLAEGYWQEFEDHWDFDYYTKMGAHQKVLTLVDKYIQQNPLISRNYYGKAQALYFLDQKKDAIAILDEVNNNFDDFLSRRECVKLYLLYGETAKFLDAYEKLLIDHNDRPPLVIWFGAVRAIIKGLDHKPYTIQLENMFEKRTSGSPGWFLALSYGALNDDDRLFEWLEKSYERREVEMTWLKSELALDPYKQDPRYLDLLTRMNFPESVSD